MEGHRPVVARRPAGPDPELPQAAFLEERPGALDLNRADPVVQDIVVPLEDRPPVSAHPAQLPVKSMEQRPLAALLRARRAAPELHPERLAKPVPQTSRAQRRLRRVMPPPDAREFPQESQREQFPAQLQVSEGLQPAWAQQRELPVLHELVKAQALQVSPEARQDAPALLSQRLLQLPPLLLERPNRENTFARVRRARRRSSSSASSSP